MKKLLLMNFILLMVWGAYAQNGDRGKRNIRERLESVRIAYITDELNLTTEESQKFWPIYNEYQDKIKAKKARLKEGKKPEDMNDQEVSQFIKDYFNNEHAILELEEESIDKLIPIIGARRAVRLKKTEAKFRSKVIQRAGDKGSRQKRIRGN